MGQKHEREIEIQLEYMLQSIVKFMEHSINLIHVDDVQLWGQPNHRYREDQIDTLNFYILPFA